ncbi:SIS domain-containing protein [Phytohabitans rumicis]|uniref:SIS domain-containing protein n=1 Tax=Phytohabitans rumicis TaxID=1076125 RepID=UPI0031F06BCB
MAAVPDYGGERADVSRRQVLDALPKDRPDDLLAGLDWFVKGLSAAAELYALPTVSHRLATDARLREEAVERLSAASGWLAELDRDLDRHSADWDPELLERGQRLAVRARDLLWALTHDRVAAAARAGALAGDAIADLDVARAYLAVDAVLDAVDRLEVRGRDSAGIQIWVTLPDGVPPDLRHRADTDYRHGAVEALDGGLAFVYKRASVIGRLGENVAFLRATIAVDTDLRAVLALPGARVTVLAHTRWASVGRISEANAHPVNSVVRGRAHIFATAALNGDIDNHVALRQQIGLPADAAGISTDAKLIPVLLAGSIDAGAEPVPAMAEFIRRGYGSFAIAAQTAANPDQLLLGVKGSGQGLYVGFAPGCFLVASEVYGLVGVTDRYLRLDGTLADGGELGTVVTLDRAGAGTAAALRRYTALGRPVATTDGDIVTAEITTRDVARGPFEHYLVKEMTEAPSSFRKSLRGRVARDGDRHYVTLSEPALPEAVRRRFTAGDIREVILVGQGTAAVACQGIATVVKRLLKPAVSVAAMPASELSAWGLRPDMSAVCLVAVSQSGTTTDTNRAVDMARARGAAVLSIVNRRDSDLTHKSDGVLYTSDGRDVEMAVASTKAFYSQVATGVLLGLRLARLLDRLPPALEDSLLQALLDVPQQLERLPDLAPRIAEIAEVAIRYPYWTVVGSGPNRVAAEETRIKLSELCYKTISTDAVEDKKHVDLSAESFVLVCAAGTPAGQVRDLTKEVEIFAAHRNAPAVIVDEGIDVRWATDLVVHVPAAHPMFAWIISTAAGHLFSYHIARAIDRKADPLRVALAALEGAVDAGRVTVGDLDLACHDLHQFVADAAAGTLRGVLQSDTAIGLSYASQVLQHGNPAGDPVEYLRHRLTTAVDELTRSIDSVKHQAKTVTVGTSRGDADLLDNGLTAALAEAGGDPEVCGYSALRTLSAFANLVDRVEGATRYLLSWPPDGPATIRVAGKTGIARGLVSRADNGAELSGSKRLAVRSRTPRLVRGRCDGRLVLMVPELTGTRVKALTLLHVALRERADAVHLTEVLGGGRLEEIRAAVTETDAPFDPSVLADLPVETVLLSPVDEIARMIG